MGEPCGKYHNSCSECQELFWCKDGFQTLCGDCAWKELEKCRAYPTVLAYEQVCKTAGKLREQAEKAEGENAELNSIFDRQHIRSQQADKMWQEATGNHNTMPDLGILLDWLMSEIEVCKETIEYLMANNFKVKTIAKAWRDKILEVEDDLKWTRHMGQQKEEIAAKQRRHRKWALKKARNQLYMWWEAEEDCEYQCAWAERSKARVGQLLDILTKHGISY